MIGDDLSDFLSVDEFAQEVIFSSATGTQDLIGIFDREGSYVDGVILESARFIAESSNVDKDWTCIIEDDNYQVIHKVKGTGNFYEYFLERTTGQSSRDVL